MSAMYSALVNHSVFSLFASTRFCIANTLCVDFLRWISKDRLTRFDWSNDYRPGPDSCTFADGNPANDDNSGAYEYFVFNFTSRVDYTSGSHLYKITEFRFGSNNRIGLDNTMVSYARPRTEFYAMVNKITIPHVGQCRYMGRLRNYIYRLRLVIVIKHTHKIFSNLVFI